MSIKGHIDRLTPENLLEGWCWDEEEQDRRIEVSVFINGMAACAGLAGLFRADILEAGIGDGFHAFAIFLPWSDPHARRSRTITLYDTLSGEMIGHPLVHHDRNAIALDDRLHELEAKARQIEMQLADVGGLLQRASASGDLFAVVGSFFTQLADDARQGKPLSAARQLNSVIEAVMASHAVLTVAPGGAPQVTICIEGSAPLTTLHACIHALLVAGAERSADLVMLDPGRFDDVAILPTVVRGLRYIRTVNPLVAEWNEVGRASTAEIVVFLNGQAAVDPGWLSEVVAAFQRSPGVGAVGGCVVGDDGLPLHGGLVLQDDARLLDCGAPREAADPGYFCARPVHVLSHQAVAIRRAALVGCGYLDELYATPEAAMMDLCLRLAQDGWLIRYLPSAQLHWLPGAQGPGAWSLTRLDATTGAGDTLRLRRRLADMSLPALGATKAAIIGRADDDPAPLLAAAQRLQDDGFTVWYLGPVAAEDALARVLPRCGARLVTCDDEAAVQRELAILEPDLVCRATDFVPVGSRLPSAALEVIDVAACTDDAASDERAA